MRTLTFAFAAVALFAVATRGAAQATPPKPDSAAALRYRFRLLGVYDNESGDPIEGVEVSDVLNKNSSLTSKTGTVSLFFLPDGGGLVRLRKIGYETQTVAVSISPADTAPITMTLSHATTLAPVVVNDSAPKFLTPGLRAFEEHRKAGFGHFITYSVFRKYETSTMANFLGARMPGLLTVSGPGGAKYLSSARKACAGPTLRGCRTSDCFVSVYQDGVKMYDASTVGALKVDFERMSPQDFQAAEFYQGAEIPPEYNNAQNSCGVLVLWTRIK